jgi:energy-converting hydrogenase Eha subunit F
MGKIYDFLKRFSFGGYRTGLYNKNKGLIFSSLLSIILSVLFLLGLLAGIAIYFNQIFIQRDILMDKQESRKFADT